MAKAQRSLAGDVVAITGGARGIGFATAERMLASGAGVSLWDVDAKALAAASAKLSQRGKVSTMEVELTDADLSRVTVGAPVRMTFRRRHSSGGVHNYAWKATTEGIA